MPTAVLLYNRTVVGIYIFEYESIYKMGSSAFSTHDLYTTGRSEKEKQVG